MYFTFEPEYAEGGIKDRMKQLQPPTNQILHDSCPLLAHTLMGSPGKDGKKKVFFFPFLQYDYVKLTFLLVQIVLTF